MSIEEGQKLFRTKAPPIAEETVYPTKEQLAKEIAETEMRIEYRLGLPFLYGWKWYKWARAFFESKNKLNLLVAANQLSKSSTQIRKCIHWATAKDLWPELWTTAPNLFWYLYPSQDVVNDEFKLKWSQFLPQGKWKDDPYYGWKELKDGKDTIGIQFNSGVQVSFKTYGQQVANLQSATVYAMFCDEELPIPYFDELIFRLTATDGYFHMVFTATIGQDEWRRAMEPDENDVEFLPQAFKQTVSMYDSMEYEDGSPSPWTFERIKEKEMRCSTNNEILKRIHGKFIIDTGGRKYEQFNPKVHFKEKHPIPKNWLIYVGADIGSGGATGHPSALCYVAVNPNMQEGRVFLGWRGDKITTTAGDVVEKNIELKRANKITPTKQYYDWANKDFETISTSAHDPFEKAEKSHEIGEDLINTLFKNNMLFIYRDEELSKLGTELSSLKKDTPKKKAKDDFCDALRYAVTKIPWDLSNLVERFKDAPPKDPDEGLTQDQISARRRREFFEDQGNIDEAERIEDEFNEANEMYG